jgi:hypothetical protein
MLAVRVLQSCPDVIFVASRFFPSLSSGITKCARDLFGDEMFQRASFRPSNEPMYRFRASAELRNARSSDALSGMGSTRSISPL